MPGWLFYWGAAVVLVRLVSSRSGCSGVSRCSRDTRSGAISAAGSRGSCSGPLRVVGTAALDRSLFAVVWAAALFGDTDPIRNLAPTWIYVIFWLGVPALSVVFGNVWRALSPWRAIADAVVWVWERSGTGSSPAGRVPRAARSLAGCRRAPCVHRARARLLRSRLARARWPSRSRSTRT